MKTFEKWVTLVELALSVAWVLEEEKEKYHMYLPEYQSDSSYNMSFACFKCKRPELGQFTVYTPDFMAEVFSEEEDESFYDSAANLYRKRGIKEYWLIDMQAQKVYCYHWTAEVYKQCYSFEDSIPLSIVEKARTIKLPLVLDRARDCRITDN